MPLKALPSIFLATNVPKEKAESLELIWRPSHRLKSVLHSSSSGCCRASTNPNLTPKGPSTVNPFNHLPASPPFPHLLTVPHVSSPPALTLASEMQSVLSTVFLQSTQANNKNNPALPALPVQWQRSLLQFVQQQRCNSTIAQKQLHFTAEQQLPAQLKNQLLNLLLHCLPIPEVWLFLGLLLILLQGIHSLLPPKAHPFQKQGKIPPISCSHLFPFLNSASRYRMLSLAPAFSFFRKSRPSITNRRKKTTNQNHIVYSSTSAN